MQVAEPVDLVLAAPLCPTRSTNCLRSSARRCAGTAVRSASGTSSSTAGSGNDSPMTAAGSMIARSSRDRSSRRAASSAWIVGGTAAIGEVARRRPDVVVAGAPGPCRRASRRAARTNSGLPSAEATIRVLDRGLDGAAEQHLHEPAGVARRRAAASRRWSRRRASPTRAASRGGGAGRSRRRAPPTGARWRRAGARAGRGTSPRALWMSSMTTTTGRRVASASRNLRAPQNTSVTGNRADRQPDDATRAGRRISAPAGDARRSPRRASRCASLGRVVVDDAGGGARASRRAART